MPASAARPFRSRTYLILAVIFSVIAVIAGNVAMWPANLAYGEWRRVFFGEWTKAIVTDVWGMNRDGKYELIYQRGGLVLDDTPDGKLPPLLSKLSSLRPPARVQFSIRLNVEKDWRNWNSYETTSDRLPAQSTLDVHWIPGERDTIRVAPSVNYLPILWAAAGMTVSLTCIVLLLLTGRSYLRARRRQPQEVTAFLPKTVENCE